jgi:hypothetical protein
VVTNLQQTCSNAVPTTCQQDVPVRTACWQACYKVVELNRLVIKVLPTTCYRPAIQFYLPTDLLSSPFCCNASTSAPPPTNFLLTLWQLDKITALLQLVDKLATRLLSSTDLLQVVELNRLVTSCWNNLLSSCNSTICQQLASDNLVAT